MYTFKFRKVIEMDLVRNKFILLCKRLKVELNSWTARTMKL